MADVTDQAFRRIIAKYGKPDVTWTEFVSADGLANKEGRKKLIEDLKFTEAERPIVAQIFGSNPENMTKAAELCREMGFDGIDINMGCPDRAIEKQGCGCGMIKDPENAKRIIRAVKAGAGDIPVSVKTRIGYNKNELETWARELLGEDIAVLTMHLRTRKEMSKVPAKWELMTRLVEIRDEMNKDTLILGNGDVTSLEDGRERLAKYGGDGAMIGRGIFGNPWFFSGKEVSRDEKLRVMVEHTKLYEELLGHLKSFNIMKKHYKAYVTGWDGAKELRMKLMEARDAKEVENIVNDFLNQK